MSETNASEIEVTPEMIEAGAAILWDDPFLHHPASFGHCEDLAEKVIRGALEARAKKASNERDIRRD